MPKDLPDDPVLLKQLLEQMLSERESDKGKIVHLEEENALLRQRLFGRKSEQTADPATPQMALFNEAESVAESVDETVEEEVVAPTKHRGKRQPLPADLPRIEVIHELPEHELICACGCRKHTIGEEISEQLEIVPMQIRVIKHVRKIYGCRDCETAPVTADKPAQLIEKSMASPSVLAMLLTTKYVDGLPLHRFEKVLGRHGIDIPRQTLARWVIQCGEHLQPLLNLMRDRLLESRVIHCDETRVQVLKEPDRDPLSPFAKDVYLLALVAHKICFHGAKFTLEDCVPVWRSVANDPFNGKLDSFFAKAMDIEQQNRFTNAAEMLGEFNTLVIGKPLQYDDTQEVMQEIAKGDFVRTDWNPYMLMSYFPPAPGAVPSPVGDKMVYRCTVDGEEALLKFFPKAVIDVKNPGTNRRILRMRKRIEKSIKDELPLPALLAHGMFGGGNGLFIVTRFEEGIVWPEYVAGLTSLQQKLEAASALCNLLEGQHGRDFAHGDLHPGNILVRPSEEGEPLMLSPAQD